MPMNENKSAESTNQSFPTSQQIEKELARISSQGVKKSSPLKTLLFVLIVSAAVVVLITSIFCPVVKILGSSMQPTLNNEDVALAVKTDELKRGDVCCFYNNNSLLVRRVIGVAGDVINVEADGTVYVNDQALEEAYVTEKALGECDITFPFTVPENAYFVMGDNRPVANDSRLNEIGCVSKERIVGKLLVTVWPVYSIGIVD